MRFVFVAVVFVVVQLVSTSARNATASRCRVVPFFVAGWDGFLKALYILQYGRGPSFLRLKVPQIGNITRQLSVDWYVVKNRHAFRESVVLDFV